MLRPTRPINELRWLPFQNTTDEEIPAFGLVEASGVSAEGVVTMRKPTTSGSSQLFVVGPVSVPKDGGFGICTRDSPIRISYKDEGSTPELMQTWGAKSGTYQLHKGLSGWTILGDPENDTVLAMAEPGAGGGGRATLRVNSLTQVSGRQEAYIQSMAVETGDFFDISGAVAWLCDNDRQLLPLSVRFEGTFHGIAEDGRPVYSTDYFRDRTGVTTDRTHVISLTCTAEGGLQYVTERMVFDNGLLVAII